MLLFNMCVFVWMKIWVLDGLFFMVIRMALNYAQRMFWYPGSLLLV